MVQAAQQASAEYAGQTTFQKTQSPARLVCQRTLASEGTPLPNPDSPVQLSADRIERDGSRYSYLAGSSTDNARVPDAECGPAALPRK